MKTSYGLLRRHRRQLKVSPNKHFNDEENADLESLPDLANSNSVID